MTTLGREEMALQIIPSQKIFYNSTECFRSFSGILHSGILMNSNLPKNLIKRGGKSQKFYSFAAIKRDSIHQNPSCTQSATNFQRKDDIVVMMWWNEILDVMWWNRGKRTFQEYLYWSKCEIVTMFRETDDVQNNPLLNVPKKRKCLHSAKCY